MFLVINKSKVFSYMGTLSLIVILFAMSAVIPSRGENDKTSEVSSLSKRELPIYSVKTDEKKVALTMNCAWNADDIDLILKTLNENKIKITFFMVGDWVDKYSEVVKKISDAGQEIGNHSLTHPHIANMTYEENVEQIIKCSEKIEKITGKKVTLYRGPYGEYNNTVIQAARENNHQVIQWSIDTLDYNGLTGEEMWKRIDTKLVEGSIILMHNGTKHTAEGLEMIIKNIQEKQYKIVPVSELIYSENFEIDSSGRQYKV